MRGLVAALLLLALLAPASAQTPGVPTILVYHAQGQTDAPDPFATNISPAGLDGMRLPLTRADGVLIADTAPEGNPDSAVAHARELQRLLALRAATGAPVTLEIRGTATPGAIQLNVTVTPNEPLGEAEISVVLVEDRVPLDLGSGARAYRFVVRNESPSESIHLSAPVSFSRSLALPPGVDGARALAVVYVRLTEARGTHNAGEIVQSASWYPAQAGPTRQVTKSVLIEHVSATWCEPCRPSDDAIDLLAARTADAAPAGAHYLQTPGPVTFAGLGLGAAAALLIFRRRAP